MSNILDQLQLPLLSLFQQQNSWPLHKNVFFLLVIFWKPPLQCIGDAQVKSGGGISGVLYSVCRFTSVVCRQATFLTNNLPELIANTTSLNPITNAPNVGVSKPKAATGMAMIL